SGAGPPWRPRRVRRRRPQPRRARAVVRAHGKDVPDTPRPPLAEGEARFVGDPVALVVAESRYVAEDAVDLVDVDYEPLPPVVDYVAGRGAEPLVHEAYAGNVAGALGGPVSDDLAGAFESAAYDVRATIRQQ